MRSTQNATRNNQFGFSLLDGIFAFVILLGVALLGFTILTGQSDSDTSTEIVNSATTADSVPITDRIEANPDPAWSIETIEMAYQISLPPSLERAGAYTSSSSLGVNFDFNGEPNFIAVAVSSPDKSVATSELELWQNEQTELEENLSKIYGPALTQEIRDGFGLFDITEVSAITINNEVWYVSPPSKNPNFPGDLVYRRWLGETTGIASVNAAADFDRNTLFSMLASIEPIQ